MAISVESYIVMIPAVLSVLAILIGLARGLWVYCLFTKRRQYLKDFERFSNEAKKLCAETGALHRHVVQEVFLEAEIQSACLQVVKAASTYDTGIRIALSAWEDMIQPAQSESDTKSGKDEEAETRWVPEKRYRSDVVAVMRKRCIEGIEKRRLLSPQMKWMLANIVSRYVERLVGRVQANETQRFRPFVKHDVWSLAHPSYKC